VPGSVGIAGVHDGSYRHAFAYNTTKFATPHTRVEYHTPSTPSRIGPLHRYRFQVESGRTVYEDSPREHVGGTRITEDYGSVPVAQGPVDYPVMTATVDSAGTMVLWPAGGELYVAPNGRVFGWPNTRDAVRVVHDGEVVCDAPLLTQLGCEVPMGAGRYRLERDVEQDVRAFRTAIHTAWDVDVAFNGPVDSTEIVPMVDLRYDVGVDLTNAVTAGKSYTATFTPGYQPGYTGPSGPFEVEAWVSHDDGATWQSAGVEHTRKDEGAEFRLRAPKNAEFVTLRVKATDAAGNTIDQTITRAWKVSPRHNGRTHE
jgi:hypothetical protein